MKFFNEFTDITSEASQIFEVLPLSGNLFSGSGLHLSNWKNYPNQIRSGSTSGSFFVTVYDSDLSVSASALVDLTFGLSVSSSYYSQAGNFAKEEKNRVYKQFADQLLGDVNGIFTWGGVQQNELFFMSLKRSAFKDAVRRGFTRLNMYYEDGGGGGDATFNDLTDVGASSYYFKGPGGDYMYLTSSNADSYCTPGCAWYDAGVIAVSPSGSMNIVSGSSWSGSAGANDGWYGDVVPNGTIDQILFNFGPWFNCNTDADGNPNPVYFHNVTNLFSRIYFARGNHNEFNYSSNPTAVDSEGRIIVTSGSAGTKSRVYITGIGLYNVNNELLAAAKLSDPIKKANDSEITVRARLLY